jgi:hypothetical protein
LKTEVSPWSGETITDLGVSQSTDTHDVIIRSQDQTVRFGRVNIAISWQIPSTTSQEFQALISHASNDSSLPLQSIVPLSQPKISGCPAADVLLLGTSCAPL